MDECLKNNAVNNTYDPEKNGGNALKTMLSTIHMTQRRMGKCIKNNAVNNNMTQKRMVKCIKNNAVNNTYDPEKKEGMAAD